jgi:hypothetical protein
MNNNQENNRLSRFRQKKHSQYGEEGVIQKVFEVLDARAPREIHWCVEFGAGGRNTNTRALIENGWHAVLIEADHALYGELEYAHRENPRVTTLKKVVHFEGADSLDSILASTPIPEDFDFLSIDIDGNDYHTWNALMRYMPRAVMIEFNGRIPIDVSFIQPPDPYVRWGSSLKALVALGKEKGYELVYAHVCNAVFVRRELLPLFKIRDNSVQALATGILPPLRSFQLYDGSLVVYGSKKKDLLAYKKKIQRHSVWLFERGILSPVPFVYDRGMIRKLKNALRHSIFYSVFHPLVRWFYHAQWNMRKKKRDKKSDTS